MSISHRIATLLPGLLLITGSGCAAQSARVQGTVTFQGKPVVVGSVTLMSAEGKPFQADIQSDGTWSIQNVPMGTYRVAVFSTDKSRPASSREAAADDDTRKKRPQRPPPPGWFPIPGKYALLEESGLSLTVDRMEVTYDIQLTE
jgi:Polysaccharide lyase family 4, domain II